MAFGFTPKFRQELPLDTLAPEQFLVVALDTAKKLGWKISYISETGFIAHTKFSMISWGEEVKVSAQNGNITLVSACTGTQLFDWGKNKQNITSFLTAFEQVQETMTTDDMRHKLEELKPNLATGKEDLFQQQPPTNKEKVSGFFSMFIPSPGFFVTPILINLNLLVFIVMVATGVHPVEPDTDSLIAWGANFRPATLEGEPWRLLTSCFLHIGIFHLLMNLYALLYIGTLLEPHLGRLRFSSAYLLTGIAASATSLWWNEFSVSAGASGAIFGMYGVFLAMLTTNLIEAAARKALLTSIGLFVAYNLLYGMQGGVDNAAHIGGLVSGLIFGYAFYPSLRNPNKKQLSYAAVGLLTVGVLVGSTGVYFGTSNDMSIYDKRMEEFSSMESMALEIYHFPPDTPREELLKEIEGRGIYYWNENIRLLEELSQLDLPDNILYRNQQLLEYCHLRIKSYQFLYKAVNEETDTYQDSITFYNQQVEALITRINGGA